MLLPAQRRPLSAPMGLRALRSLPTWQGGAEAGDGAAPAAGCACRRACSCCASRRCLPASASDSWGQLRAAVALVAASSLCATAPPLGSCRPAGEGREGEGIGQQAQERQCCRQGPPRQGGHRYHTAGNALAVASAAAAPAASAAGIWHHVAVLAVCASCRTQLACQAGCCLWQAAPGCQAASWLPSPALTKCNRPSLGAAPLPLLQKSKKEEEGEEGSEVGCQGRSPPCTPRHRSCSGQAAHVPTPCPARWTPHSALQPEEEEEEPASEPEEEENEEEEGSDFEAELPAGKKKAAARSGGARRRGKAAEVGRGMLGWQAAAGRAAGAPGGWHQRGWARAALV